MAMNEVLENVKITPLARRVAAERGIDIGSAHGSGYAGRIFTRDLDADAAAPRETTEEIKETLFENQEFLTYIVHKDKEKETAEAETAEPEVPAAPLLLFARDGKAADVTEETAEDMAAETAEDLAAETAEDLAEEAASDIAEEEPQGDIGEPESAPVEGPSTGAMIAAAISADSDVAGVMRMNDIRRSVAEASAKRAAQTAAVTQFMETDVTELSGLLERVNATRERQKQISFTAFYLKAIAFCVRENERFRMRLSDDQGAYLVMEGAHIGLQVGAGDGVVTPVIREADIKTLDEIAEEVVFVSEKAKRGAVSETDCKGGAVTLLDKMASGIFAFTPIIKQPESAIIGIGAPYQRLIMTGIGIENRQFVMQSLTFDHRIMNGSEADEFQVRLKEILEEPGPLFG